MSQTTTIRSARDEDLAAIHAIYAHHVATGTGSFELDAPSQDEMGRRLADVRGNGLPWLVAEHDGRVSGYAYANLYRTRPAYRFTVEDSIYLAADVIGRGTGRRLLAALIEECERAGCRQMVAVIGDSANTASISLHARMGFRFSGVIRSCGWKFDRWLDTVLMQRDLGTGERTSPRDSPRY